MKESENIHCCRGFDRFSPLIYCYTQVNGINKICLRRISYNISMKKAKNHNSNPSTPTMFSYYVGTVKWIQICINQIRWMGKRKHLHVYKCILLKDISGKCVSGKEFMKKKTTEKRYDKSYQRWIIWLK